MLGDDVRDERWHRAIEALLQTTTVRKAAALAGIAHRTLTYWLADPDFRALFRAAREEAYGQALAIIQQSAAEAAVLLVEAVRGEEVTSQQIRAAETLLQAAERAAEHYDMRDRLRDMEMHFEPDSAAPGPSGEASGA